MSAQNDLDHAKLMSALMAVVEKLSVMDVVSAETRLEQRVETRLIKLEEKIDKALGHLGEVGVLQSKVTALESRVKILEVSSLRHTTTIEGLKTWRSILSSILAIVVAPLAIWAFTQVLSPALN